MKFIRRDYTAFVGIPNTRAGIQDFMCSEIADMIVSSDTGWEYDTRTPNKEAFIRIPLSGYTGDVIKPTPVLYLRNSVSGCKMMVCNIMFHAEGNNAINLNEQPISKNIIAKGRIPNSNYASGIGISMIPPDVSDEYPDEYTEETTFGDGSLLVMTEAAASIAGSNYANAYEGYEQKLFGMGGTPIVSYGMLVDQYSITLFGGYGITTRGKVNPIFTTGKVLGTLAYDTEIAMQSYGSIRYLSVCGGNTSASGDSSYNYSQSVQNSSGPEKVYYGAYSNYYSSYPSGFSYACTQFFKQDGARYNYGYYGIGCNEMLSDRITNSQSPDFIRWVPGIMFASYSDTPIYEGGDGFKGYLDTNLIRYAIANKGQLFNNGQFCCVADNLLLKWDPDATDTILA
jgi:hypothetical protein